MYPSELGSIFRGKRKKKKPEERKGGGMGVWSGMFTIKRLISHLELMNFGQTI